MSVETSYRTEVVIPKTEIVSSAANIRGNPCLEILQLAVDKVAEDRGGSVGETYSDSAGRQRTCLMSMSTPNFPLGIGISVGRDGRINFHYDALGGREIAQGICDEVTQNYVVIAVMRAQRMLGFDIQVQDRQALGNRKMVTVLGVK